MYIYRRETVVTFAPLSALFFWRICSKEGEEKSSMKTAPSVMICRLWNPAIRVISI